MVTVASVEVVPGTVDAVQGDEVQLAANVLDDRNERLPPRGVEWRSDDPEIASVDASGLMEARAPGSVRVRASYRGVSGSTEVRVLRGPAVEVGRRSVTMYTAPGGTPEPEVVGITNGGAGDLTGLEVSVRYGEGQTGGWLGAELTGPSSPAELTLSARAQGLEGGMYEADVEVRSTSTSEPAVVAVELSVAGFEASETDGRTAVREGGATDRLSVRLSARPSAPVVLNVASSDPGEARVSPTSLRFTPGNWSTPQTVTVRGVDDDEDDGDQSVRVIVSVDVAESHDAFEGLGDRTITVVNADDDEPVPTAIVTARTGPDTRVRESGTYDSIHVRLSTAPVSDVVVSVTSEDPSEVAIASPGTITFTPANWSVVQTVVVRGVDDVADDGDRDATVRLAVVDPLSADAYDGRSARVTVRNVDNDRGGGGGGGGRGGRGGGGGRGG